MYISLLTDFLADIKLIQRESEKLISLIQKDISMHFNKIWGGQPHLPIFYPKNREMGIHEHRNKCEFFWFSEQDRDLELSKVHATNLFEYIM